MLDEDLMKKYTSKYCVKNNNLFGTISTVTTDFKKKSNKGF